MLANYHTHTARCGHARGSEREYIESAIKSGIKVLGFADHTPQIYKNGYHSPIRMTPEQAPEYVSVLKELAREYKNDIELHVGLEAEYFPELFDDLRALCNKEGIEYLILGQHYLEQEEKTWCFGASDDAERLHRYVDTVCAGLSTLSFSYLAHPDVLNFTGEDRIYREEMLRLCTHAKSLGIPLEVNMLGLVSGRHYPCEKFYKIAAEVGNDIIIGCDAHEPELLLDLDGMKRTEEFALSLGLNILTTLPFRAI